MAQERVFKDSGIEWIGQIPSHWEVVPTKRIFSNSKKIAGKNADNYERLALTMNGVIKRSKEDADGLQPESFEGYQILDKNELVFKLIDLANVNTSRVGISPYTGLVSPAYIILHNNQEHNRFYYYYFMNMYYQEIFNYLGGEGVRSALNAKDLLEIPLFKITESEQQAIADYLDVECGRIDSIIDKNKQIIEKLKEYKKSLITETVTKGLNPNAPMKDSGIEWIGKIPSHWEVTSLKNLIVGIKDGTHGSYDRVNKGEYLLSAKNVFEDGIHISKNESCISINDYKSIISNGYPSFGDILVCCVGTIGRCCIYTETKPLAFQRSVSFLRASKNICNKYLLYLIMSDSSQNQLMQLANSSAQAGIYMGNLKNIKVPLCKILSEQQAIADYLDKKCSEIDSVIEKREKMIDLLSEYKKSLIYECVTGKKEIA